MYPDKLEYYLKLIDCSKKANEWKLLETASKRAMSLTSVKGMLYYNMALAQRNRGNLKLSFENVQKSLNSKDISHKQIAYIFYLKAQILVDINEYDKAEEILKVIVQESPDFVSAKILLDKIRNMHKD